MPYLMYLQGLKKAKALLRERYGGLPETEESLRNLARLLSDQVAVTFVY